MTRAAQDAPLLICRSCWSHLPRSAFERCRCCPSCGAPPSMITASRCAPARRAGGPTAAGGALTDPGTTQLSEMRGRTR